MQNGIKTKSAFESTVGWVQSILYILFSFAKTKCGFSKEVIPTWSHIILNSTLEKFVNQLVVSMQCNDTLP